MAVVVAASLAAPADPVRSATLPLVDDFESGLPSAIDGDGVPIGFVTLNDPSSVAISTTSAAPADCVSGAASSRP